MQTNFSRFFADATVDVLSTFMDAPAEVGPPTEVEGVSEVQEVTVLLGLTGSLEGCFFLEFSKPSALKICEFMNFGEPFEELDDFACATLCELANLAGGRAVTLLNDNGGTLSIAPPTIFCGKEMRIGGTKNKFLIPVSTEAGCININVSIKNSHSVPERKIA